MIEWHYSRPALASEHLVQLFEQGMRRMAFFGRRRIGKTEYIRRDLMPAALDKGIKSAVYCSMWENKDQPHLGFIRAIQDALPTGRAKVKGHAGFSLGGFEIGAEVERAERPRPALPNELTIAASLFNEWVKHLGGSSGLILMDEIQHLATSSHFATFAASLRTMLDMAPDNVSVVFTGSSLADLQRLFNDQKAPFFGFASVIDFPLLDRKYIDHLISNHHQITRLNLDPEQLIKVFERTGGNAQIVTGLVEKSVVLKSVDIDAVWRVIEESMLGDDGWCELTWKRLGLNEQLVYLLLKEGQELFSETSLALYESHNFSRGRAQHAIRKLVNQSLIHRTGHGVYERVVPMLDEWLDQENIKSAGI